MKRTVSKYCYLSALLLALASPQVILGQSLELDGSYDFVNINTVADEMHAVYDWAVSFWVKPDLSSFDENEAYVVGINTSTGSDRVLIGIRKSGGYPVVWDIGGNTIEIVGNTGVNTSIWNHIVYYKSGSSAYLYLNGNYQGTHTPGYSFSNTDKWTLGMEYDGSSISNEYAGLLDEVAIWDDALTASEITALYNSGVSLPANTNSGNYTSSSDLVGYWHMDEGSGISVADSSGNNNSGTITGATWNNNTVTDQGTAPTATDLTFSVDEDTVYNGTIYGTDDDDALSFSLASNPSHGRVALEGCADFTISSLPFSHQYSNVGQGNEWDMNYSDGADVAYKLTLSTGTTISVTTCAAYTNFDTKLQIFTADGQCVATATSYYNDDDLSCGYSTIRSKLPSCVLSAGTYYIVVDGFSGNTGNYQVDVAGVVGRNDNSQMEINDRAYELDKLRDYNYSTWEIDQLFSQEATPPVNNNSRSTTSSDFTYRPTSDFSGNDSFTFIVSDGIYADTGTVSITVNSTNDDPVAGFHTALDLDGVDDYLHIANFTNVPSSQVTISAWIKTTSTNACILQQGRSSTDVDSEYILRLVNGKLNFWDYSSGFGFSMTNYSNATVNSGSWTYICFVKSGTTGKYYINGVLDNTVTASLNASYSSNDFVIGKDYRDNNQKFAGQIDELRIWNTAHTDEEVNNHMYQMPAANSSDLVGYWQMNKGTGDVAYDASSSYNSASLHNMTNSDWVTSTNAIHIASNEDNNFSGYLAGSDQDNDALTFTVTTSPANGSLAMTNSTLGAFLYIPNTNFHGSDSLSYTVTDGSVTSSIENVSVAILPIADAPVASNATGSTNENTEYSGTITASDADGDSLDFSIASNPSHGSVMLGIGAGCADFTISSLPFSHQYSNVGQGNEWDVNYSDGADVAYKLTLSTGTTISVTTCAAYTNFDTKLQIFTADGQCVATATSYYNDDDPSCGYSTLRSKLPSCVLSAGTYYIVVDGISGNTGNYQVDVADVSSRNDNSQMEINDRFYELNKLRDNNYSTWEIDQIVNNFDHSGSRSSSTYSFTYTPQTDYNGSDSFTFIASDGSLTDTATVTITVNSVNNAPIATASAVSTAEDTDYSGTITATDSDNDPLIYSLVTGVQHGTVSINDSTTGSFTYSPSSNYNGSDSFSFSASDGTLLDTAVVSITITMENDAPIAVNDTIATDEDYDKGGTLVASDAEYDAITFTVITNPTHGTVTVIDAVAGTYNYSPAANYNGSDSFAFQASDGTLHDSASVIITINSINDSPVASSGVITTNEDTNFTGTLTATDADNDSLTITINTVSSHGAVTVTNASTGAYSYSPNTNYNGSDSFILSASDGTLADTALITITVSAVNDAPAALDSSISLPENSVYTGVLVATDLDNDSLTYSVSASPSNGTVSITNTSSGAFTYTPTVNYDGTDSFNFLASDGSLSDDATISITVLSVADPPVTADTTVTTPEDTNYSGTLTATDPNGDELTFSILSGPTNGTAVFTNATTGAFTYSPTANYFGSDAFTARVTDGGLSDTATVTVSVTSVNDPPTAADASEISNEDSDYNGTLFGSDVEDDSLTFTVLASGSHGTVVLLSSSSGGYKYMPNPDYNGSDQFSYTVSDASASDTATISITVLPVNDAPTGVDLSFITTDIVSYTGTLSATDIEDDSITFSILGSPEIGTVTITNANTGVFSYSPMINYQGNDAFDFTASDGSLLDTATVSITVNDVNAAPVVSDFTITLEENSSVSDTLVAADIDGDLLSYAIANYPDHGYISMDASNGTFTYDPDTDYDGTDEFTFRANDGTVNSSAATVSITITNVNRGPTAQDSSYILLANMAFNGVLSASDEDGDDLSFSIGTNPTNGTVTLDNSLGCADYSIAALPFSHQSSNTDQENNWNVSFGDGADVAYKLVLQDSTVISVSTCAPYTNFDTKLEIFTADNQCLAATTGYYNDNYSCSFLYSSSTLESCALGPGIYYVVVDGFDGNTGNYQVDVAEVTPGRSNSQMVGNNDLTYEINKLTQAGYDHSDINLIIDRPAQTPVNNGSRTASVSDFTYTPNTNYSGSDEFTFITTDGILADTATISLTINLSNYPPVAGFGSALSFDGDDDFIQLSEVLSIGNTSSTIGAWVKIPEVGSDGLEEGEQVGVLFGNYPSSPNSRWSIDSNGKLRILWHNGQINLTGSTDLRDNTWHHIALVRDISNSKFYAYIDGANEIITGHDSAGDNESFTATHRIGADNSPNPNHFHGMIDELQIWNVALTPTMIVESLVQQYTYLMPPANNPGLIANWHMDDGSGTIATDVGVNGIHGTLNNMEDSSAWVDSSVPISFAIDEDMSFMAYLPGYDIDNNELTFILESQPDHGTVNIQDEAAGSFIYTPDEDFHGTESFTWKVSDGLAETALVTASITVNSIGDAPVANDMDLTLSENTELVDTLSGYDADGDSLLFAIIADPAEGSLELDSLFLGAFTYVPVADYVGSDEFMYTVSDGESSDTATVSITVTLVNYPPVAVNAHFDAERNTMYNGMLLGSDPDDNVTLSYTLITEPVHGVVDIAEQTGRSMEFTGTNNVNSGNTLQYQSMTVAFWAEPEHSGRSYITRGSSHGTASQRNWDIYGNGSEISFSVSNGTQENTLSATHPELGDWHYVVATLDAGGDSMQLFINNSRVAVDHEAAIDPAYNKTMFIGGSLNHRFIGRMDEVRLFNRSLTHDEIEQLYYGSHVGDGLLMYYRMNSTYGDTVYDSSENGVHGIASSEMWNNHSPVKDFTYMPTTNSSSVDSFYYAVSDGELQDTALVHIDIDLGINIAPVAGYHTGLEFDGEDDYADLGDIMGDGSYTKMAWVKRSSGNTVNHIISGSGNDHALWASVWQGFKLSAAHNGSWEEPHVQDTVALATNQWHFVAVTFELASGGVGTMTLYKDGAAIDQATDVPVQNDGTNCYLGALSATDFYHGNMDEVSLWTRALTAAEIKQYKHRTIALDANGLVGYWHMDQGSGLIIRDATANENDGDMHNMDNISSWITSNIEISYVGNEEDLLIGYLPSYDLNGNQLSYSMVTAPAHGTVSFPDSVSGTFAYTPLENYYGEDSFTWKASDGIEETEEVNIALSISPVQDSPTAYNMFLSVEGNTAYTDTLSAIDVDGDEFLFSITDPPVNGSVELTDTAMGVFTYNPNEDYIGNDMFSFAVNDGQSADTAFAYLAVGMDSSITAQFEVSHSEITEGDTNYSISVVMNGANLFDVFIPYTISSLSSADIPFDFIASNGWVTIPAGNTESEINIQIVDDDIYELTEEIIIMLGSSNNTVVAGNVSHFVEIRDNDYPAGWDLNPANYEYYMFVTGIISGVDNIGPGHFLGAFQGQECRGLITPVTYNDSQIFQMMVYNNASSDNNISFRYYSAENDSVYGLSQTMIFSANDQQGTLDNPYVFTISALSVKEPELIPEEYALHPAYPNPFNPVTTISYDLPNDARVSITIYDMMGREVRELFRGHMQPGYQFMQWDGKDMFGTPGPSGMYIVVMQAGEFMDTKKIILLK